MLLILITLFLHYDLVDSVIDEKVSANFNETALMRKHHENYIQVKTFIKDAEQKFQDDKPTRVDHRLATTKDIQSTKFRNWLLGNPSSVDPGNENHPYLPFGRSRPTFPDEIIPYTSETKDHHLTLEEILPNWKSKTNESSSGIDFEISTATNSAFQMPSVSLVNFKERKGFKPVDFEMKANLKSSSKKEHFILNLSNPIESRINIDNTESSTLKFPTNLHPSSKVIADPEFQKRFLPNESRSRFVNPEFNLRRPMSNKSPSKKLTVDPHNFESMSETSEYRDRSTAELSRSRNPLDPPFKTSTSSVKYEYRFDPSLQTKEFILIVNPVPVTAESLSSLKALKPYPKTIDSSKKTTKAKISSKTFKPSPETLQSSGPKIKSSSAQTLKSFRPTYLESSTKALKSRAKIFKSNVLEPSPKKTQFMKLHNFSPIPTSHTKTTFRPKTLLRGHSGEGFKFNTSLRRPDEVYEKKWVREITTYMPYEKWVLTLMEKIGLTTRKSFSANPIRNLGRVSTRPHALVSSKQLKKYSQNQVINFLRQGPPRTRTMIDNHLSTTTAEYEDYGLSTTSNNVEDHKISTTTTAYEDYSLPTTTKEVEDYKLPTKLTNIGDYGLSTTPNNVEDIRISTTTTEYEEYGLTTKSTNVKAHRLSITAIEYEDNSLPTMPNNIENHRLSTTTIQYDGYRLPTTPTKVKNHRPTSKTTKYEDYNLPTKPTNIEFYSLPTTTKEVEDDSLPTTPTNVEDHTLSTTVTNKLRFTIENHGGILHLITIPGDDEDASRVRRPGFIVEDEEMLEPLTTVDVRDRDPVMINTKDGMFRAQHLAAQKIDKTRRQLLKEKKKRHRHRHNTRHKKHKHRHRTLKNRKKDRKQKNQEIEYPLLYTDLRKRLSIGTPMKLPKENQSNEKLLNRETYPLKAIPELSNHNDTVIEKIFRLTETQDKTPEFDNKNLYNKVKETLKQAQIRKEVERQKRKAELIRRIAEGSSYSDEEESLKRNLVQALQYGNRTSKYDMPFI